MGDLKRVVVVAFGTEGSEAVDELFFLFTITGKALVEQPSLATGSLLFLQGRIPLVFDRSLTLRFANCDLQLVAELGAQVRVQIRRLLHVLEREFQILNS